MVMQRMHNDKPDKQLDPDPEKQEAPWDKSDCLGSTAEADGDPAEEWCHCVKYSTKS